MTECRAQVTYEFNGMGRAGHALKDMFSAVIISEIFNLRLIGNPCWQSHPLIAAPPPANVYPERQITIATSKPQWEGVSKKQYREVVDLITRHEADDVLFRLKSVFRIHISQVHRWEVEGELPEGIYERCLKRLRTLYWGSEPPAPTRLHEVAIHARRGDVADPAHRYYDFMGPGAWTSGVYRDIVDRIRSNCPDAHITIYSETKNASDLLEIDGVSFHLGTYQDLKQHFRNMVTASCFVPACSSLSLWAIYLSQGLVMIPPMLIRHFDHPYDLPNWWRM